MRTLSHAIVLAVLVVTAAPASANTHRWASNASSCVPGDPAIQNDLYLVTGGSVKFASGASGRITLYCPVSSFLQTMPFLLNGQLLYYKNVPNVLRLTYQDSDGIGTGVDISVQLLRLSKLDGSFSSVPGAFFDSSQIYSISTTPTSSTVTFTPAFDFDNFYYYVRVDLVRDARSTSSTVTFYGVALEEVD